ncbi:MAG: helix-turn-helix domain-containing protein [Streptosporangiaceae bacterium]
MFEDTASALSGAEGLRVTDVQGGPGGALEVRAVTDYPAAAACPACGMISGRVHETVLARPAGCAPGGRSGGPAMGQGAAQVRQPRMQAGAAEPDARHIGAQLKAARQAARMTMAKVAEQSGLTKGFVSKLERDLANVSVASLIRLCEALGVSVGSLFQPSKGEVVRRGAYPPINFGGREICEYLLTPSGEKRVQAILSEISPGGGSGNEPYSLPADVEFVFVLAGRLEISVAGQLTTLGEGDAFTFPASTQHAFRAGRSAGPAQVLWVFSPALPDAEPGDLTTGRRR